MGKRIKITAGVVTVEAELNDSDSARSIAEALPIESRVNTWGEEIYFAIPVQCELAADARTEMAVGELGYWPPGSALCIFFGRTPASTGSEPRAASPVNPVGKVLGDATVLKSVEAGAPVRVEAID